MLVEDEIEAAAGHGDLAGGPQNTSQPCSKSAPEAKNEKKDNMVAYYIVTSSHHCTQPCSAGICGGGDSF